MKKRILGRTGIGVSELCLGTMNFGWATNREESTAILDRYHAAGGNFILCSAVDMADGRTPDWTTLPETYVGEWLGHAPARREDLLVATQQLEQHTARGRADPLRDLPQRRDRVAIDGEHDVAGLHLRPGSGRRLAGAQVLKPTGSRRLRKASRT